jgi:hypothetical protein
MPRILTAYSLTEQREVKYIVETEMEAHRRSRATWAEQYDRIERRVVSGGTPAVWQRMEGNA